MRKFLPAIIVMLFSVVVAAGLWTASAQEFGQKKKLFTKHFSRTAFDITRKGLFSIEVLLDESEYKIGKNVVGIIVHDANDKDVVGAELTVIQTDLDTKEDVAAAPVMITDKRNGLFTVSGLDLKRKNRWELSISVKEKGAEDGAKFIFPDALKSPYPKGRYSP